MHRWTQWYATLCHTPGKWLGFRRIASPNNLSLRQPNGCLNWHYADFSDTRMLDSKGIILEKYRSFYNCQEHLTPFWCPMKSNIYGSVPKKARVLIVRNKAKAYLLTCHIRFKYIKRLFKISILFAYLFFTRVVKYTDTKLVAKTLVNTIVLLE